MNIILVVDDEPLLRMIAAEMLEDIGHTVQEFGTAAQAIAYCDVPANDVMAVLTDIDMPGEEDGLDLARHIIATRPGVAVVVTSGRFHSLPEDLKSRVRFLPKPWTPEQMIAAMRARAP